MATLTVSAFLWVCAVTLVSAIYDPEVCSIIKDSYGLIPPIIPRNLEYRGEHVDYTQKNTVHIESYLDNTNSRAKFVTVQKGIEHHYIFDYQMQQVIKYDLMHPGAEVSQDPMSHACKAESMEDSEDRFLFGFMDVDSGSPKMFTGPQHMRFGGQYPFAANGTERIEDRGLLVDKFVGCVYDQDLSVTMQSNYSFNNIAVMSPGGTLQSDITGVGEWLLSVPVKADMFGVLLDGNEEEVDEMLVINKTEHFYWFRGEPEFNKDTFQIPRSLYCEDYRGRKPMPSFPTAFRTRLQKTRLARGNDGRMAMQEVTSFEQIYYYKEKNLARRDYTPEPGTDIAIFRQFQNFAPVKTIYDFNEGVKYVTNKPTGRCFAQPIGPGDFFVNPQNTMYVQIAEPQQFFDMQVDEMEYKGTAFARDIESDVWAGRYHDKKANVTYIKELQFSTNGWHERVQEKSTYGVPVEHTIYHTQWAVVGLYYIPIEQITGYSFLMFKPTPPRLKQMDVSNCLDLVPHKNFVLFLDDSDALRGTLFGYELDFLETAQFYLTDVTQVATPLRIQKMLISQVSISDWRLILHFTVVDKTPLNTKIPVGQNGASLSDAITFLHNFILKNQFAIKFYPPGSKEMTLVTASAGSLYVKSSNGQLQSPFSGATEAVHLADDEDAEEKEHTGGMSSGNLAMLGMAMLFIGVGIGICIMYLYIRHFSEEQMEDRIHLSSGGSPAHTEQTATTEIP